MPEPISASEGARGKKATLIAKIDERVLPALDCIASTNQIDTSQLMCQFFSDVADSVDSLASLKDGSSDNIEEKFARLILERCPGATTEALRVAQRIWERAAQIKAKE